MSRYDGLIIPRSYSEYINKTDAATLQQALQLSGVLSGAVADGDNKAVKSGAVATALENAVATALENTVRKVFNGYSNNSRIITFTLAPNTSSCYECRVYFYGGLLGVYSLVRDIFGGNGAIIKTIWEGTPKIYLITVDESSGIVSMAGTDENNVLFEIYKF